MPLIPKDKDALDIRVRQALLVLLLLANLAAFAGIALFARPVISAVFAVVNPFMVAMVVAYIFHPFATFMQNRLRLSRVMAVAVTYMVIVLVTLGFVAVLLPVVYFQFKEFITRITNAAATMRVEEGYSLFGVTIRNEDIQTVVNAALGSLDISQAKATVGTVAAQAVDTGRVLRDVLFATLSNSLGIVAFASFVAVISFYFLLDYDHVRPFTHVVLGRERETRFFVLWGRVDKSLSGYLRGQLTVALIVGTLFGLGLSMLGMKSYSILVGFIAGVANLIPYIGPVLGFIPAVLWLLITDTYPLWVDKAWGGVYVLLLTLFVQGLDGFVLHPKIAGQGAELHPLAIMLALIAGAQFGIGGMILAVPAAIVVRVLGEELWWKPLCEKRARDGVRFDDDLSRLVALEQAPDPPQPAAP